MRPTFGTLLTVEIFAFFLLLSSCNKTTTIYDKYLHTPERGWDRGEVLIFDVPGIKVEGDYLLDVLLRTSEAFPFTFLCLEVKEAHSSKNEIKVDTLFCQLLDEKGNVLGGGVSRYQYVFPFQELNLNKDDTLHFEIRHIMNLEKLPGISDLGLKLSKKKTKKKKKKSK